MNLNNTWINQGQKNAEVPIRAEVMVLDFLVAQWIMACRYAAPPTVLLHCSADPPFHIIDVAGFVNVNGK